MRFLADENVHYSMVRQLREQNHDVLWAVHSMPTAGDESVLQQAINENRIVITFDKDFGALTFKSRRPAHCGIILIRMSNEHAVQESEYVLNVLNSKDDWSNAFWVIENNRIRRRDLPT